jgi:hypothetical protein
LHQRRGGYLQRIVMKSLKQLSLVVIVSLVAYFASRWAGTNLAKRDTQQEATKHAIPAGFFNVAWLSSAGEVKRIHPDAAAVDSGDLSLVRLSDRDVLYERDVEVSYFFKNDALVLFVINFAGPASKEAFDSTQMQLVNNYGPMPEPSHTDTCKLDSKKKTDRFVLEHCNREAGNALKEQLLVFRTPAARTP